MKRLITVCLLCGYGLLGCTSDVGSSSNSQTSCVKICDDNNLTCTAKCKDNTCKASCTSDHGNCTNHCTTITTTVTDAGSA